MQFLEYVFSITLVYVLNYPIGYPDYPNAFVVFGQMSLLSLFSRFWRFVVFAHMNMSKLDFVPRYLKIGTTTPDRPSLSHG